MCGVQIGRPDKLGNNCRITQEYIAKELGISVRTIRNLKQLQTLSPDLQQLIEDGSVKYTTALNVFSKLSNEEQEKLIGEIGQDKISLSTEFLYLNMTNTWLICVAKTLKFSFLYPK